MSALQAKLCKSLIENSLPGLTVLRSVLISVTVAPALLKASASACASVSYPSSNVRLLVSSISSPFVFSLLETAEYGFGTNSLMAFSRSMICCTIGHTQRPIRVKPPALMDTYRVNSMPSSQSISLRVSADEDRDAYPALGLAVSNACLMVLFVVSGSQSR